MGVLEVQENNKINFKNMFDKLNNLVNNLNITSFSNYKQVKEARKVLQEIKNEAQKLRNDLTENHKLVKSGKEPKITIKERIVVKDDIIEPVKINNQDIDDEFFNNNIEPIFTKKMSEEEITKELENL